MKEDKTLKNGNTAHILTDEDRKKALEKRMQNRKEEKAWRDLLKDELSKEVKAGDKTITKKRAIAFKAVRMMLDDNISDKDFLKALEVIRDTIGEKPIEKVEVGKIDREQSLQELNEIFNDTDGTQDNSAD